MSTEESTLFANNLIYEAPSPSSVTTNRVLKRQQFQNRSYSSGQTMTCTFNTGVDFVDQKNSSLVLTFALTPAAGTSVVCGFGEGSGVNFIQNIRIYHRSGTCYTNTQRYNLYRRTEDVFNQSQEWFNTIGSLMGYGTVASGILNNNGGAANVIDAVVNYTVVIPLTKVHPFFDSEGGLFLPSAMASGLRIEIDLPTLQECFFATPAVGTTAPPISYSITNIYFNTMSVSLMDSAQASINTAAQQQSLEYVYKDIFTSRNSTPSNSSSINIDINRSVGYADHATTMIQVASDITSINADSFIGAYYEGQWWYTLGSNQFPNQKIEDKLNAYSSALITFDKYNQGAGYPTKVTPVIYNLNAGIYSVSLERDTSIALSQSPVNSSRALRFELTLTAANANPTITTVFLTYVCSARSSMLSSKVDI